MDQVRAAHITIWPDNQEMAFTQHEIDKLNNIDTTKVLYYIVQGELSKEGKQHFQIFAQFNRALRYKAIKKAFNNDKIHIKPKIYGEVEDCRNYCTHLYRDQDGKPKDIWMEHYEYGELIKQGKKKSLEENIARIKNNEKIDDMLIEEDSGFAATYSQYFRTMREIETLTEQKIAKDELIEDLNKITWTKQQSEIIETALSIPSGRHVHWYWETKGGVGKSTIADYLSAKHNAFVISGGKIADVLHAYRQQRIVIIDLPKNTDEDAINHTMLLIEKLLARTYIDTKYDSKTKYKPKVQLIVFSNKKPPIHDEKLSKDRWIEHDLNYLHNDKEEEEIIAPKVLTPQYRYKCHKCDDRFKTNIELKEHIQIHYNTETIEQLQRIYNR